MLSAQSIQQVKEAPIEQVISHFITLKNAGTSKTACCPFHAEKSPSFHVNIRKGIYKCFGCGAGGDAIKFVMQHTGLPFLQAIEKIAAITGIALHYEAPANPEEYQKKLSHREALINAMALAAEMYKNNLWALPPTHPVQQYLQARHITKEEVAQWQLGWVDDWRSATPELISKNLFAAGEEACIIRRSKDGESNYDFLHHRLTFPITNHLGLPVSMGGRIVESSGHNYAQAPKYLNGAETPIYSKSKTLYGLAYAHKAIKEKGCAILVEGYMDVITMHKAGHENTIGTCGTALTAAQANYLKQQTSSIVLLRDGDAAGTAAIKKDIAILLPLGFNIQVCQLSNGLDPDQYINTHAQQQNTPLPPATDAMHWLIQQQNEDLTGTDVFKKSNAQVSILQAMAQVPDEMVRSFYFDDFCSSYKIKNKKDLQKRLQELAGAQAAAAPVAAAAPPAEDEDNLPPWVSKKEYEHWRRHGYFTATFKDGKETRYGFYTLNYHNSATGGSYTATEITNFTVTPVMHVYKGDDSRHIIEINNGYLNAVKDVPSKIIPSTEQFQAACVTEGSFMIFGSKLQWQRVASDLLHRFPRCTELEELGWHPGGFFAYSDYIYQPATGQIPVDNYGIFNPTPNAATKKLYLLPQQSQAYIQTIGTGADPFENDRVLTYRQSPVTFSQWCKMVHTVYAEKGITAIAFCLFTLFRDITSNVTGTSPHLYLFGPPRSGKSVLAKTIYSLFYAERNFFIAYEGTTPAFYTYLSRFNNCPAAINELDVNTTEPDRLQAIKGAFDLEGREKMNMALKNKRSVTIQRINSSLILIGQHIITTDDNAMPSRCIIEDFLPDDNRTDEQVRNFDALDQLGKTGISSLLADIQQIRTHIQTQFRETYLQNMATFMQKGREERRTLNQRIVSNYAILYTCYQLAAPYHQLPVTVESFYHYCYQKIAYWSNFIAASDTLADFWRFLQTMYENGSIKYEWDLTVNPETTIEARNGKTTQYDAPTPVLYVRLNTVHKTYLKEYRSRHGKDGISYQNLEHYLGSKNYYLGPIKQKQFSRFIDTTEQHGIAQPYTQKHRQTTITSCHAFNYQALQQQVEGFSIASATATTQAEIPGFVPMAGVDEFLNN